MNSLNNATNNPTLISVVMTTFNGSKFLQEQIESILSQTLPPAEIIVCDDHSTDDTVEILKYYQNKNVLTYYVNESRLGVIANFKKAVSLASQGHFIALSDQDDLWFPEKLEHQYNELIKITEHNSPAIVYSDLIVIDDKKNILTSSFWNELGHDTYSHSFKTLLFGNFITGCTIMMNDAMRKYFIQMPENVPMHDGWLALIAYSFGKTKQIKEPLVQYRKHNSNVAYDTNYKKLSKISRWLKNIKMTFVKNDYLLNELKVATLFYANHQSRISEDQKKTLLKFLRLKNKSFIQKKITFFSFFKNAWKG